MIESATNNGVRTAVWFALFACAVLALLLSWMPVAYAAPPYGDCNVGTACVTCAPTCAAAAYCRPTGGPCDCVGISGRLQCIAG